ncbi:MAG: hypothetical protein V7785_02335 [Bermanella sp.]
MVFRLASYGLILGLLCACSDTGSGVIVTNPSETQDDTRSTSGACEIDTDFFANRVWPRVLSQCASCHNAGGLAGESAFILQNTQAALDDNFSAALSFNNAYPGLLLDKPSEENIEHGGGTIFHINDDNYAIMSELLARFEEPIDSCEQSDEPAAQASSLDARSLIDKLTLASPAHTFREASLLLAGQLPSAAETAAISESNLKSAIRNLMVGDSFEAFLMEAANDQLLTMKWAGSRTPGLSALNGEYFYPQVSSRIAPLEAAVETANTEEVRAIAQQAVWDAYSNTNLALAQEPLRLISHVVTQEHPYSEVLTANYMLVNPYTNDVFDTGLSFSDPQDPNDWKEAQISSGYRNGRDLPHSGILTSPMYLARYPSTDTNRNRARSRWTYYFFLGVDIEGLAIRPMNGDSLMDVDNPTLNNPDCAVCHEIMDPVAGAFQNWGNDGQFRDQCGWFPDGNHPEGGEWLCDLDALPWTGYKEFFDPYVAGDLWYRDMRSPGFNTTQLPASQGSSSLAWLAQQMIEDARFSEGTVRFWFKGLFAREPVALPGDADDAQFASQLAAYEIDTLYVNEFASAFANGSAGTANHGAYNLKDLLVDMLVSPLFRAQSSQQNLNADEQNALVYTGTGRLLTPEQLNRKLLALLGQYWSHVWDQERNQLLEDFYGFYGGIDSDGVTDRNGQLNTLMSTVIERFSSEMVCRLVIDEFELNNSQRLLFGDASINDTPQTSSGVSNIKLALTNLIIRLWGPDQASAVEVEAAYNLFVVLRNERLENSATAVLATNEAQTNNDDNDEFCQLDWGNDSALVEDSNQVLRPWMGVLMYLISDYKVMYL